MNIHITRKTVLLTIKLTALLILVTTGALPLPVAAIRLIMVLLEVGRPAPWKRRLKRWLTVAKLLISL
jgi:hypothetical protein|tara:strand:+ start:148 stop:351 length:204 start_codon:yes stop_codon:yes gene_type:complete